MQPHDTTDQPQKLCECGCGQPAPLAKINDPKRGYIKGQPMRFVKGHWSNVQPKRPLAERFWEKVKVCAPDECWEWQAGVNHSGYGNFQVHPRDLKAHRVAWELTNGDIPDNLWVLHKCDNPPCCNPKHLYLGTPVENSRDRDSRNRANTNIGEKHGCAKLTGVQVLAIRLAHFAFGVHARRLATVYPVTESTVDQIVYGAQWKHLPILSHVPKR